MKTMLVSFAVGLLVGALYAFLRVSPSSSRNQEFRVFDRIGSCKS
jgi:hypothetical protein